MTNALKYKVNNFANYQKLTQEIFDSKVINKNFPTVFIFGAEWSGNAEMMSKVVEQVARDSENTMFYYVDIEVLPDIAGFFGIRMVPTIILIHDGEIIEKIQGFISASKLRRTLAKSFDKEDAQ